MTEQTRTRDSADETVEHAVVPTAEVSTAEESAGVETTAGEDRPPPSRRAAGGR